MQLKQMFRFFLVATLALQFISLSFKANAEEKAFHRICDSGEKPHSGANGCLAKSDFIQKRDQCSGKGNSLCFGVGRNSDGWVTDLIRNGKCGEYIDKDADGRKTLKQVSCDPMPFRYGVIEYKTNGMETAKRWQAEQVMQVKKEIIDQKNVFLVVFVHGWHHDSREVIGEEFQEHELRALPAEKITQDRNLLFFKHMLAKTRWELDQSSQKNRKVLGVYIGWDGGPPDALLNAGDRASAANRVGLSSDFNDDIKAIIKTLMEANPANKALIIGHSYGGRIVARFMLKNSNSGNLDPLGPGTLAVTLNPAISADAFDSYMLYEPKGVLPAWVNITSKDDWATGLLFEAGSLLISRPFSSGRGLNDTLSSQATGHTIGHYRPYQTHRLSICHDADGGCKNQLAENECKTALHQRYRSATKWFEFKKGENSSCHYLCNSFGSANKKCEPNQYLITTTKFDNKSKNRFKSKPGNMWNVTTDLQVIGPDVLYSNQMAIEHNAFIQTNLNRMLVELTLSR